MRRGPGSCSCIASLELAPHGLGGAAVCTTDGMSTAPLAFAWPRAFLVGGASPGSPVDSSCINTPRPARKSQSRLRSAAAAWALPATGGRAILHRLASGKWTSPPSSITFMSPIIAIAAVSSRACSRPRRSRPASRTAHSTAPDEVAALGGAVLPRILLRTALDEARELPQPAFAAFARTRSASAFIRSRASRRSPRSVGAGA